MLDVAVAYNRYRFIGDEFLTWLWYQIEKDPDFFTSIDPDCVSVELGGRMVLENRKTKSVERVTIKGDEAGLEEGRLALQKGALVAEMSLIFKTVENQWSFSIKGESLNFSNLKTPAPAIPQGPEDMENFITEKIDLIDKPIVNFEKYFKEFIKIRISKRWTSQWQGKIGKWVKAGLHE
jgi:hypothetical protein